MFNGRSYHTKLHEIDPQTSEYMQSLKMVIMFTQKQAEDDQLDLFHHHIKFHPNQMNTVGENEERTLTFLLILWVPGRVEVEVSESGIKW